MYFFFQPKRGIITEEGQIWGRRLRCRFTVSTGAIPNFPEGYKHILMSRGGASNGKYYTVGCIRN